MSLQKVVLFASGSKDGGGSGFKVLQQNILAGNLSAEIVAVVSNHANGGVRQIADQYGISFVHFDGPLDKENYRKIVANSYADWALLSGWLKLAVGLNPRRTINIHPGLTTPEFSGEGKYGHHVHEAVAVARADGTLPNNSTAVSMHFVTEKFDEGPLIFQQRIYVDEGDDADTIAERVNRVEHAWQWFVTNLVITGKIKWNGGETLVSVPYWYFHSAFCPDTCIPEAPV